MFKNLASAIFPRCCVGCGEAIAGEGKRDEWEYLCGVCARELRGVEVAHSCTRCAVGLYGVTTGPQICAACREKPPVWGQARSLLKYTAAARAWVKNYKYSDARWVEREWEKLLKAPAYAWLKEYLRDAVLVPVPLHPIKKWLRGFNQSTELAKALVRVCQPVGAQINEKILVRERWTRQQARLKKEDRAKNVRKAFAFGKIDPKTIKGRRVVIVDDLLTTGETLAECARVIKRGGVARIDVLTLARG